MQRADTGAAGFARLAGKWYMRARSCPPMASAPRSRPPRALVVLAACGLWLCGARGALAEAELSCISCPDGLFLNQTSLACAACPANSRVLDPANASSVLACTWEAGFANTSAACAPCNLASYKPALGNVSCTMCPINTNTTAVARVALAECLCAPGFLLHGSVCTPCAAGFCKGNISNEACAPCPVDTYCPEQSIAPVQCVGNSSRLEVGWATQFDCLCRPGFFTEDALSRTCRACPIGTFNARFDQRNCTACPAGTVNTQQAAADAAACIACGANSAAPAGSSDATACKCNIGYAGKHGAACVACPAGKYGSMAIVFVPPPLVYDFSGMSTVAQWRAYASTFATFAKCDEVTGSSGMLGIYHSSAGDATLTYDLPDNYDTVEARIANAHFLNTVNVFLCRSTAGVYACTLGATAGPLQTETYITQFLPGDKLFVNEVNAVIDRSLRITVTKFVDRTILPYICAESPADTYNAELHVVSIESCLACPANTSTTNHTGSGGQLDCVCRPGFRTDTDDASKRQCAECGPGRLQPAHNATACDECAAGTYSAARAAAHAATCVKCAPGSFSTAVASGHCELCAADTWQDLRRVDAARQPCERCPRNSTTVVTGSMNVRVRRGLALGRRLVCGRARGRGRVRLRAVPRRQLLPGQRDLSDVPPQHVVRGAHQHRPVRRVRRAQLRAGRGRHALSGHVPVRRRRRGQRGPQLLAVRDGLVPAVRLFAEARARRGAQHGVRGPPQRPRRPRWSQRSNRRALRAVPGELLQRRARRSELRRVPRQRLERRRLRLAPALPL